MWLLRFFDRLITTDINISDATDKASRKQLCIQCFISLIVAFKKQNIVYTIVAERVISI